MSSTEKTPLLPASPKPSHTRDRTSSFYFEQKGKKGDSSYDAVVTTTVTTTSGHGTQKMEEVELLPPGVNSNVFESRRVVLQDTVPKETKPAGMLQKLFKPKEAELRHRVSETRTSETGTLLKQRKVPIKVEPKVFFANERTFIAWLHVSTILAGGSIAIVAFASANPYSQMYGIVLLPISIAFIVYAMFQYVRRASMIRRHEPGPYEDLIGPTVLGIMLMFSIVLQFTIKMYTLVYH